MALFKSQLATQISGSVGGTTYGHNSSGMYMRSRSIPVQPNSAAQVEVRQCMSECVNAWKETLTAAQRAAWELYAQNVTVTNKLGDVVNISGQNWFVANNIPVLQSNFKLGTTLTRRDDAPTVFDRGDFTNPDASYSEATGLSLAFTDTDAWANEDGSVLFIFEGSPQDASINFFKNPFRLVGVIEGDGTTPPTSPKTITAATLSNLGYTVSEDQRVWTGVSVSRADGRLTSRRTLGPDDVAA